MVTSRMNVGEEALSPGPRASFNPPKAASLQFPIINRPLLRISNQRSHLGAAGKRSRISTSKISALEPLHNQHLREVRVGRRRHATGPATTFSDEFSWEQASRAQVRRNLHLQDAGCKALRINTCRRRGRGIRAMVAARFDRVRATHDQVVERQKARPAKWRALFSHSKVRVLPM